MIMLEKWTPTRELELMDRRMRRIFHDLGVVTPVAPAADIYETDGELVVELEVPGFDEKELEVEVHDHTLSVKGERKEATERKDKTVRLRERLESAFERSFALPPETDSEHVSAVYEKGVLTLHVPKMVAEKPHIIEIAKK